MKPEEKLNQVLRRLELLLHQQERFRAEIHGLKKEVLQLRQEIQGATPIISSPEVESNIPLEVQPTRSFEPEQVIFKDLQAAIKEEKEEEKVATNIPEFPPKPQKSLEEYIGGNLINKIGIVILIIGLGLFVKYAIDNGLLPPFIRVILGFMAGGTLIGLAWKFKEAYKKYAAVLFSGGMATLYFTAFLGHVAFEPPVLPRMFAFALMEVFTIGILIGAAQYRQQVIGLIGMVGAYAVPLLLSNNSGNFLMFLAYISVVNLGILSLAAFRNWRATIYSAFVLTWIIFMAWMINDFSQKNDIPWAWFFATFFFVLFYATLVIYQILNKEKFSLSNIAFIFLNAFIFYGLNILLLDMNNFDEAHGLFTLLNGLIHLGVGYFMYYKLESEQPLHILASLFIFFVTIAIPIQFDSLVVIIALWTIEAVALLYIAYHFSKELYQTFSYLALALTFATLLSYWSMHYYNGREVFMPILNLSFLSTLFVLGGLGAMNWLQFQYKKLSKNNFSLLTVAFVLLVFFTFFGEIFHVFAQDYVQAQGKVYQPHILYFQAAWLFCYTFAFLTALGWLELKWLRHPSLRTTLVVINSIVIVPFLIFGFITLNELRTAYAGGGFSFYYIFIRYICYAFLGALVYTTYLLFNSSDSPDKEKQYAPLFYHAVILMILSSELTTIMLLSGAGTESLAHRVGYSILWGLYALLLTVLGFWKKNPYLRYASMALFGVTLLKVFLADLRGISTTSRMVVFISLGVLLLVISYLYQRFFKEEEGASSN